jgi:hypothetical protein
MTILSLQSLPRQDLDSAKAMLSASLVLGAKGFERKSLPMAESACHVLCDRSCGLYQSYASDDLFDTAISGFDAILTALCADELQGELLFWAALIILSRDSTADLSLLSCHMATSLAKETTANPKSLNPRLSRWFEALSNSLSKAHQPIYIEWFTLLGLLLQTDIFENRRVSLEILSQLTTNPIHSPIVLSRTRDRRYRPIVLARTL